MLGAMVGRGEQSVLDVRTGEIRDRVARRFVQQHDVVALRDGLAAQHHPHPAPQRLGIEQPGGQRLGREEGPDRSCRQRTLLPR
jgi:hypothetical protein